MVSVNSLLMLSLDCSQTLLYIMDCQSIGNLMVSVNSLLMLSLDCSQTLLYITYLELSGERTPVIIFNNTFFLIIIIMGLMVW